MPCGLTYVEQRILYILYRDTCFKANAGFHSEKLKKNLKYPSYFDDAILKLKNLGLISTTKKAEPKFYITNKDKVYSILAEHGWNVIPIGHGRTHHIN